MANICSNIVRITHADPAMIDRLVANQTRVLSEFVPVPADLQEDENRLWVRGNWGIKHDIEFDSCTREDANTVFAYFDTAWAPPVNGYSSLEELGFEIEAYYLELGSSFCGMYANGSDMDMQIEAQTAEWAEENIPEEINEAFGLVDMFAEYQAINE